MTPFAVPLISPAGPVTPPPPPPPSFSVACYSPNPTYVTGASGSASVSTAVLSNGTAPYSYSWEFKGSSSPRISFGGASGATAHASWSGVDVGPNDVQSMLLLVTCTDATGQVTQAYATPSIQRTA